MATEATTQEETKGNGESTEGIEEQGITEADALWAIVVEARRSPKTFRAKDVEDVLSALGYSETWDDAKRYLEIEHIESKLKRRKG